MNSRLPLLAAFLLLAAVWESRADLLAKWSFTGEDGMQSEMAPVPGSVAQHLTASAITRGEGFMVGQGTPGMANTMAFFLVPQVNTAADAVDKDAYFEIVLTPEPGHILSIRSVAFSTKRASKLSGPNFFVIRSSLDGFDSDLAGPDETQPEPTAEAGDVAISLGGSLENLRQPVTLRFYGYGRRLPENPDGGIWCIGNNTVSGGFVIEGAMTPE